MLLFLAGIAILIVGYYTYGRYIARILGPDDRPTPAVSKADGVDFVVLPHWKNMLIQLLNIAGIGPVIGVILGIKFGVIVFIIIPIGNIIAGATHDFLSGMMSIRHQGANLPFLVKYNLGTPFYRFFSLFMTLLLLLVVAVFINIPAQLVNGLTPDKEIFWWAVVVIFIYYVAATLFPVDKIIGKIYPIFGALLLFGTLAIFFSLLWHGFRDTSLLKEGVIFKQLMFTAANDHPIIPLLFVTIACGIISGFHATQSPIIARTMATERNAQASFYGMMIVEGIIGMIWAGAGLAIYNLYPLYMAKNPALVLNDITNYFLGTWIGMATVIGVIILAVTSGDTAMRSLRLSLAEIFSIDQKSIRNRILLCLPLIMIIAGLLWWSNQSAKSFAQLWNYFAWGNQVLAGCTLLAASVWLQRQGKNFLVALLPGMFMAYIVFCYILWISPEHGGPVGVGLRIDYAYWLAGVLTVIAGIWTYRIGGKKRQI